jgi:AcrR family transcriptional regulator
MAAGDRRQAIMEAAVAVFSERGYHEASLDDVAAQAKISKALIYEHFGSKRELHVALLELHVRELLARLARAVSAVPAGEERLREGLEAFLGFVEEHRGAWRMIFRNSGDPEIADAFARMQVEVASVIAALMATDAPPELEQGRDRELAIEIIAQQLVGAAQSLANWWNDHQEVPRERLVELVMDFAWIGLDRLGSGERWSWRSDPTPQRGAA